MNSSLQEWKAFITSEILIPKTITNKWLKEKLSSEDTKQAQNIFPLWGFCYQDLKKYDLSKINLDLLLRVPFDSSTKWPKLLPEGFDPEAILSKRQLGYQLRELHNRGITGSGVVVAVIDHPSNINHVEVKDNIKEYIIMDDKYNFPHFHGLAVLSHLCGKSIGIAPGVKVYFYGGQPYVGETTVEKHNCIVKFAISCLQDIKEKIKNGILIRIVNMSNSWLYYGNKEYQEEAASLREELAKLGCIIIDSPKFFEDFRYLDCKVTDDFEVIDNYNLPSFFGEDSKKRTNFLTGGKVVASYLTKDEYIFDPIGSASYSIPQLSAFYALALQVNPTIAYHDFSALCREYAILNNKGYRIINPIVTIKAISIKR